MYLFDPWTILTLANVKTCYLFSKMEVSDNDISKLCFTMSDLCDRITYCDKTGETWKELCYLNRMVGIMQTQLYDIRVPLDDKQNYEINIKKYENRINSLLLNGKNKGLEGKDKSFKHFECFLESKVIDLINYTCWTFFIT